MFQASPGEEDNFENLGSKFPPIFKIILNFGIIFNFD